MLFIMKNEELFPFLVEAESGKFLPVQSGVLGFDPYKFILRNLESCLRLESRIQVDRIPKLIHSAESRIYYCLRDYLTESTTYIEGDTCIKKPKSQIIQP